MLDRVTSLLELLGVAFLTTAVGLAVFQRFGLIWALVVVSVVCFGWSLVFEAIAGRRSGAES